MKTGWTTKSLSEVCNFSSGLWKGKKPPFRTVGVIRNTNFNQDGSLDDSDIAILDVEEAQFAKRSLRFGDIILEKSGGGPKQPVGRVIVFDKQEGDYSFSNFTARIRSNNPEVLNPTYLHRFLYWIYAAGITEGIQSHSTGIRNLDLNAYKNLGVSYPSLKEQERIVTILDEAFEGIATAKANAEKNLQNARNIFDHHLEAVFNRNESGWVRKSVSELAEHSLGKMLDKQKNRGEPKPYLRNVNVRWFGFDLSGVSEMRFFPEESDKYRVSAGDVVVCEGGYPGRAAIWSEDTPMYFQKALHRVRFHEPTHSKWFLLYLYSQSVTGRLKQHFTGSGIQHFTGAALGRFVLPVAPKKRMIELLTVMKELQDQGQNLEVLYQNKLASLEELKQSILHQPFTGKL